MQGNPYRRIAFKERTTLSTARPGRDSGFKVFAFNFSFNLAVKSVAIDRFNNDAVAGALQKASISRHNSWRNPNDLHCAFLSTWRFDGRTAIIHDTWIEHTLYLYLEMFLVIFHRTKVFHNFARLPNQFHEVLMALLLLVLYSCGGFFCTLCRHHPAVLLVWKPQLLAT